MKRALLVVGLIAAAAIPAAVATAGSGTDRATGGGQVLFSDKGAGNTIAFTAQGTPEAAKGQVQVVDRENGVKFHGIVECLDVQGNMAEIGGVKRGTTDSFQLYVVDNGEGANQVGGGDVVFLDDEPMSRCDLDGDDDDDGMTALGRGNAQVYDAP